MPDDSESEFYAKQAVAFMMGRFFGDPAGFVYDDFSEDKDDFVDKHCETQYPSHERARKRDMNIEELNDEVYDNLECDGCNMCDGDHSWVGMDSWNGGTENIDILFMGLNPGREEAAKGFPFVGKSGMFLRESMKEAGLSENWAIVNSILCSTNNEADIPDVASCRNACKRNVGRFFAKLSPKVVVPCGNGAAGLFGLETGIMTNSRRTFVSKGPKMTAKPVLVLPIVHPSSLIRNGGKSAPNYDDFIGRLVEIKNMAQRFNPAMEGYNIGAYTLLFNNNGNRSGMRAGPRR